MPDNKPPLPMTQTEMREAVREGIRDFLDEKFREFGKWSLGGLAAMGLAAIIYLILFAYGWKPPT